MRHNNLQCYICRMEKNAGLISESFLIKCGVQQPGAALARGGGPWGPDLPAPVRDTREIDANLRRKFSNAPAPIKNRR